MPIEDLAVTILSVDALILAWFAYLAWRELVVKATGIRRVEGLFVTLGFAAVLVTVAFAIAKL